MAGLLQAYPETSSMRFTAAVLAEFLGSFLFAVFGAAAPAGLGAVTNGLALAALVFATANVSGGHLNPAVTASTIVSGHIPLGKALAYMLAQTAGATTAAMVHVFIIPGAIDVGVFSPAEGVSYSQAFGWELLLAFLLVSVVYATAIGQPSFGINAPLAIGLSLYAGALTGGVYTGAAVNPARVLGPAFVFKADWTAVWVYTLAELVGGVLAGLSGMLLYGTGPYLYQWSSTPPENPTNGGGVYQTLLSAEKPEEA